MQLSSVSTPRRPEVTRAFDLSAIENAREAYFLPGIDRFAASVAECATTPVTVHVDIGGQFMEYTLQPGQADGVIPVNVNGQTLEITRRTEESGQVSYLAESPIGNLDATLQKLPDGSRINGLVGTEAMPFTESIHFDPGFATTGHLADLDGNFACSRMWQEIKTDGDHLKLEGALGSHWISSRISAGENVRPCWLPKSLPISTALSLPLVAS